ncbi:MAG: rod shape-determining protein MreC [Planctomycetota bacterium]|jgi:cell shape-determining protein MreC
MDSTQHSAAIKATAICLLAAVVLAVLPESAVSSFRDLVRAAMVPGQRAVQVSTDWLTGQVKVAVSDELAERERKINDLQHELAVAALKTRRSQLRAGQLSEEISSLHRNGPSPFITEGTSSLVSERAVEARVLGSEALAAWKSRRLLDQGEAAGLAGDEWILDGTDMAIDAGLDQSLSSGLPVFSGRCVVGRIVEAGRFTSSLELLTAPSFRAQAVIVRDGTRGLERAELGLIEGTGQGGCRVAEVDARFSVEIGDAVYSVPDPLSNAQMIFGYVTAATLEPGALHWDIAVEPAASLDQLRKVQIVVPSVNPDRLLGQR